MTKTLLVAPIPFAAACADSYPSLPEAPTTPVDTALSIARAGDADVVIATGGTQGFVDRLF